MEILVGERLNPDEAKELAAWAFSQIPAEDLVSLVIDHWGSSPVIYFVFDSDDPNYCFSRIRGLLDTNVCLPSFMTINTFNKYYVHYPDFYKLEV